jgi:hypothetical protein
MADTRTQTGLTPQIWDDQFSVEYFQSNPTAAYSGTDGNNVIVMKEDLASKRADGITFEFITRLTPGVKLDRSPLKGFEQRLGEYGDKVLWNIRKEGISVHELDTDLAAIDLRQASKTALRNWADEDIKLTTLDRLQDMGQLSNVPYADATAAQRNTWDTTNADRVLYARAANRSAGNHAASLANITNLHTLNRAAVGGLKRIAALANPKVTPIKVTKGNRRVYVLFVHPFTMRDIRNDIETVRATVNVIEQNDGIFMGGDIEYDGVVIHEVDDMPLLAGAGASSINLAPAFLCGVEALGWGIKSRFSSREDKDDYGQVIGLGMVGKWGMKKLAYQFGSTDPTIIGKQRGVVSAFFPAIAD